MGKPGTKLTRLNHSVSAGNHTTEEVARVLLESYWRTLEEAGEPEEAYRSAVPMEHRKRLGQFFTPPSIASFMADWITAINPTTILDPAVGLGIFPRSLHPICPNSTITCIDVDHVALSASKGIFASEPQLQFIEQDFLTWPDERLFDAAIANPPYLRHHDVYYPFDIFGFVGRKNHVHLSRLSNIYVLFILEICRRLREGGRAAIIVPGEWVNANFGDALKCWLISRGLLHTLLYFSHASSQFEDALTTASILLLEKPFGNTGRDSIRTVFVKDGCSMEEIQQAVYGGSTENRDIVAQQFLPEQLLSEKKWNHLLAHGHKQTLPGYVLLSELAETRRGIATGCNSFFHLIPSAAKELRLRPGSLTACIGRALDVEGVVFRRKDFEALVKKNGRAYLFDVKGAPDEAEASYIRKGESEGLHERYLCAARNGSWYAMERRPGSAIWATVFGRQGLRFVYNAELIANLTTFHCIYPKRDSSEFAAALAACLNSQIVQDRARRQHRVYGGGLLKVEPKDLLDIEVPDLRLVGKETLSALQALLYKLDEAVRIGATLNVLHEDLNRAVEKAAQDAAALNPSRSPAPDQRQFACLR